MDYIRPFSVNFILKIEYDMDFNIKQEKYYIENLYVDVNKIDKNLNIWHLANQNLDLLKQIETETKNYIKK